MFNFFAKSQCYQGLVLSSAFAVFAHLALLLAAEAAEEKSTMCLNFAIAPAKKESLLPPESADWNNPKIIISDQTVCVMWGAKQKHSKDMEPGQISQYLQDLPVSAWPYGRIVELSDQPLGSNIEQRKHTRSIVSTILKTLGVSIHFGPPSA
jgi:predicted protein tyrosine phosphatase